MKAVATLPKNSVLRYDKIPVATLRDDIGLATTGLSLLVGLNGEGKTTFLRWLCALLPQCPSPLQRGQAIYLPESLDWPGNLHYLQLRKAMAPDVPAADSWAKSLALDVTKRYGLLSKGNRQKVRLLLTEALAVQHAASVICLDEPLSGLDFKTREVVWRGWHGDYDWSAAHRVVSMHPSDIPYNPDQVILASKGTISLMTFTGALSWDTIKRTMAT
jgi:ABC-2 type transport system ATP-binding protein